MALPITLRYGSSPVRLIQRDDGSWWISGGDLLGALQIDDHRGNYYRKIDPACKAEASRLVVGLTGERGKLILLTLEGAEQLLGAVKDPRASTLLKWIRKEVPRRVQAAEPIPIEDELKALRAQVKDLTSQRNALRRALKHARENCSK